MSSTFPSSATLPPAVPARAGSLAILIGGSLCGFGLGALLLSVSLPDGAASPAVPPLSPATAPRPQEPPPAPARPQWPELFGMLEPEPEPEPEPEDDDWDEPEPIEPLHAQLKGVALDEAGGWALIQMDDEVVVLVRPGSQLTPDHRLVEVLADAVVIETPDGAMRLGFADSDADEPVTTRIRQSPARAILSGRHDFDDMPMPLPPDGYRPGPGFSGPDNH